VRWALLGLLAAAAIVVAVVAAAGGGSEGTSEETMTDYQALLELIPSGIRPRCKDDRQSAHWMVTPDEATAETLCSDPADYYLSYGLWRSPREARDWVSHARDADTLDCDARTLREMKLTLPGAKVGCEDKPEGHPQEPGITMWWTEKGSRVAAWFGWNTRDQVVALDKWRRLVTSA
jgi:hypothetical protein